MRRDPLGLLDRLARDHEAVGLAPIRLAATEGYLVFAPELVELVLRARMRSFNRQTPVYRSLSRFLGNGILTSEGEHWRKHRRVVQPAFHRQRLRSFGDTMVRLCDQALAQWGTEIHVADEMMRLTLAVVGEVLFGTDMDWMAAELGGALDHAQRHTESVVAGLIPADDEWTSRRGRRFAKAVATLDRLAFQLIDERRAKGVDGDDVLGMLLAARDEEGRPLPRQQVRDEVMTLLSAGHETTANALTWSASELARHPEVMERLVAEVDALGDRAPGSDDLPALTYTRRVLDEAMRLHPPVWTTGRIADEPVELGAVTVRPGELVLLSPWVTHRLPGLWDDPLQFDPDRWARAEVPAHPFAFFPFGGGARKCVGEAFAYLEATLILARVAQRVRLEPMDGLPEPEPQLTLGVRGAARTRVTRR
tara:strand:+ start:1093 stop:2358 length:1266 start_codon:yes stop_codon:yes gene_type:complete